MQRRQYLHELQAGNSNAGDESPDTSEDSRISWQVDEPVNPDIALTGTELCLPVPADALSEKLVFVLADPSQSLARLALHVRHRCGVSNQVEEMLEAEVQRTEAGIAQNGSSPTIDMNGADSAEAKHIQLADDKAQRAMRFSYTSTESQSDAAPHGVLLFASSLQTVYFTPATPSEHAVSFVCSLWSHLVAMAQIDKLFLPTDIVDDIGRSWLERPNALRLDKLNAQLVTATEAQFMLRRAPVNSITVKVSTQPAALLSPSL